MCHIWLTWDTVEKQRKSMKQAHILVGKTEKQASTVIIQIVLDEEKCEVK